MNWSSKNSIWLSRLCVVLFGAAALAILISAPWLVKAFVEFSRAPMGHQGERLLQPLRREVASQVYGNQYLEKHTEIICCTLGYRAGIIGAAMLAKQA